MNSPSSRLANVLAAWLVLAGTVLIFIGLLATRDNTPVVGSEMRPPAHWTARLRATTTADDRDEAENHPDHSAPASFDPTPTSGVRELMY
jgi:hypothetical protein